jgi:TonB-linked SusC/RagA family outer membrane protein
LEQYWPELNKASAKKTSGDKRWLYAYFFNCKSKLMKKNLLLYALIIMLVPVNLWAQQANSLYEGNVLDVKTNSPLQGATVQIKGTSYRATTDKGGAFKINAGQTKLPFVYIITYVGFQPKELTINNGGAISVSLEESASQLTEVVVSSGYVSQSKKDFTGSASQVKSSQLKNQPAQSFDQLLGGQAAGVSIVQPSNSLNNTPALRVRGINSVNSGIYPLVIVDGVTVFTGSVGGAIGNNPLADINPNDIETIDVLKDASATAIYGSRAANGVLVITTKKGKRGKTKVTYDGWASVSSPYNLPELLNAEDYVTIKNEAKVNAGQAPGFALQKNADGSTVNTDWYDVAYHKGVSQSHAVGLSGATDATSYYFSLSYSDQNSFVRTNNFKHYSARLNVDHHLAKGLVIGANITYSNGNNTGPTTGAFANSSTSLPTNNQQFIGLQGLARLTYILPPNVSVYNTDGSYNIQNAASVGYGANNPAVGTINAYNLQVLLDLDKNSSESNSLLGNVYAEWELVKGLKLKTSYGIDNLQVGNKSFFNPIHGDGGQSNGLAVNTQSKFFRSNWTNTLAYATTFGNDHHLKALVGYEQIDRTINAWGAQESNLTDPFYTNYQGGWANFTSSGNVLTRNSLVSYFSNINYDFQRRYLLSFNFRRDGLSALAPGNKYGNFGGGSVGWNISEEKFYKDSRFSNIVNNLKIRASYGIVGNSEIGDFPAIGTFGSGTYNGLPALGFSQAGNSGLKWERSRQTNIGLNFSLLNSRINVEADYYRNNIDGLILQAPQAPSRGIPGNYVYANAGALYNTGIEVAINSQIVRSKDFQWNASLNFSTLKNKVTELYSDIYLTALASFGIQNITRVGESIGAVYAVPTTGVNPATGYRVFVNRNGEQVQYNQVGSPSKWTYLDGTTAPAIDNYADGKVQGPSLPTYFGGFNNNFAYKNFDLTIGIIYSGGNKLYNGTRATISDQRYFNSGTFVLDRWTKGGQVTEVPKVVFGDNVSNGFSITNSAYVEDGSFVKLKNVVLGYNIPLAATKLASVISSAHLYAQASNIFTITKYRGSDPEVSINGNSINSGKDQNVPPNARVFTVGLNLGF